ncbi:DUF2309 domain-containing protein [soil metagenome]
MWPLASFIAVNPMSAHESQPFGAAAPTRDRATFLAAYDSGRISDADLVASALRQVPELASSGLLTLADRTWTGAELVAAELVHSGTGWMPTPPAPQPDVIDSIVATWIAAYLDPEPIWRMPGRGRGLWTAWSAMARYDPTLPAMARRRLRTLPANPDQALSEAFVDLGLDEGRIEHLLRSEIEHLPGWVGYLKWRADHVGDVDLTSYLAIRVALRRALSLPDTPTANAVHPSAATETAAGVFERAAALLKILSDDDAPREALAGAARILALHPTDLHPLTWQVAFEENYRRGLLAGIGSSSAHEAETRVQVVMCIDPRSEGLRRHLEADPGVETFGFAGFFGVPIRFASHLARGSIDALPALIAARHSVTEAPVDSRAATRRVRALRIRDAFAAGFHAAESSPAAPFALAETVGWFLGAATLLRTLSPRGTGAIARWFAKTVPVAHSSVTIAKAFSVEERAAFAETAIRMMGLADPAPLVVLAGHGSTSSNNLYQSALDCGACGGNPGAANARAAAAIFNDPAVRAVLADRGLQIPDDTFFVAAEHDTVSDLLEILDPHLIPESHASAVSAFVTARATAARLLITERAAVLPGAKSHSVGRLRGRAHDWAEVYPELGLAGNAAMIVGPRGMTRDVNLDRRVFLHSYETRLDPEGVALETIMTAPLVVAQWINHQYYFSTVDKVRWGAGTKTIHNAIGTFGVLAGQAGDLRQGLPLQSVAVGDHDLHEPMRLAVVIQAPLVRIAEIISRNQVLRHLFDNQWITLHARDDEHAPWHRYGAYGFTPDLPSDNATHGG